MDLARSFNVNDPDFIRDPYPVLAELRRYGKPIWHEEMQLWLAATHADASAVLRSKTLGRVFSPNEPEELWETFNWLHADSIMEMKVRSTHDYELSYRKHSIGDRLTGLPPELKES